MFLLGHLGIGLGLAWVLSRKSPTRIDYRLVLFGAILPDLIDKPLAYVTGLDSRIWAHTFLFLFAILALSFVPMLRGDRKSTRLNSSHVRISYAVFCLKKKKKECTSARAARSV